ncbi:MAG: GNAT family N-acetyltransferase [Bacteroidota bacterium]
MEITIRRIGNDELHLVQEIAAKTWPSTFAEILSESQIDYMLKMMYSTEVLSRQLSNGHQFLIAFEGNTPLGFAGIELNFPIQKTVKIHKLYVLPQTQGKGIGVLLLNEMKKIAIEDQCNQLLLNVNRFNKATNFYSKYGFEIVKEEDIDIGNGYFMNDYVMEMKIKS